MNQSRLSSKIQICQYLESASNEQTLEVIEWIKEEFECSSMNELLIKVFIKSKELFTNDALINIANKTNINNHNLNKKQSKYSDNSKTLTNKHVDNKMDYLPLLKLPNDLINNIALLLNEKDLIYFERCNRMFYKMINNSSFLKKSRNFKKFLLKSKFMTDIVSQRIDCYKYSFANEFDCAFLPKYTHEFDFDLTSFQQEDECSARFWQLTRNNFKNMLYYGSDNYKYHSDWLTSMFKSTLRLNFGNTGILFVAEMPIDLLFDRRNSKLSQIELNDFVDGNMAFYWFSRKYLRYFGQDFEASQFELELKRKLKSKMQGKLPEPKVLDMLIIHGRGVYDSDDIEKYNIFDMIHLEVYGFKVDCKSLKKFSRHLRRVTLGFCEFIITSYDVESEDGTGTYASYSTINTSNNVNNNNDDDINIDTLRLLSVDNKELQDILFETSLIKEMNFESTLKNLTIRITTPDENMCYFSGIFRKENLFNLENVNILFRVEISNNDDELQWIDDFFDILQENIRYLKHQFKQLNFGINGSRWDPNRRRSCSWLYGYSCFSWDSTINNTFINNKRKQWKSLACDMKADDWSPEKDMFDEYEEQWV